MTSVNWQQSLAMLDANLKHVATEWLRQAARNSATTNVQLNDEFRQTFLQISNDSLNAAYSIVKGESQFNQLYPAVSATTATVAGHPAPIGTISSVPVSHAGGGLIPFVRQIRQARQVQRPLMRMPTVRRNVARAQLAMPPRVMMPVLQGSLTTRRNLSSPLSSPSPPTTP